MKQLEVRTGWEAGAVGGEGEGGLGAGGIGGGCGGKVRGGAQAVRVRGDVCSVVHAHPLHASAQHSAPLHASAQHGAAASRGYTLLLYFIVSCMYSDVF